MQDENPINIAIGRDENNKIVIEAKDKSNKVILKVHHEAAAIVAEAILLNVAEVEIEIENAVERLTQLG